MEQPKKPGANRDIADLKARLGLLKGPGGGAPGAAPGAPPAPFPAAAPTQQGYPGTAPVHPGHQQPAARAAAAAAPAASMPLHDPYAAMKPPPGRAFDLRAIDDGAPVANVRSAGGKAGLVIGLVLLLAGAGVGYGFGAAAVGRRAYNQANAAAKKIKTELEEIQKVTSQIGAAVSIAQQRAAAEKRDPLSYDAKLIGDLEKVKLDPRPDTSRIFKVDYARLDDLAVDRLMNYYYDSIALYSEVDRHIKRTKADKDTLEAFATRQAAKGTGNYGIVFDSRGKLVIGSLVEVGSPVCKGGTTDCPPDQVEGFQIRSNTGAPWTNRKISAKVAGDIVVPLDRSPLLEAVMSGSPEQVRNEQYKQRYNNIRLILVRLAAEKKELTDAIEKAAGRPDLFTF